MDELKASSIKALPVRSANATAAMESVRDLILDLHSGQVVALHLIDGSRGIDYGISTTDLGEVSEHEVVVRAEAAPVPLDDLPGYLTKPTFDSIYGQDALDEGGNVLGKLADLEIDLNTWRILTFDIAASVPDSFEHGLRSFPAESVRSGERSITITSDAQ